MQETATYEAAINVTAPAGLAITVLPADPSVPGNRYLISATSSLSAADARQALHAFLQACREAANAPNAP